jgi:hypothetical protein
VQLPQVALAGHEEGRLAAVERNALWVSELHCAGRLRPVRITHVLSAKNQGHDARGDDGLAHNLVARISKVEVAATVRHARKWATKPSRCASASVRVASCSAGQAKKRRNAAVGGGYYPDGIVARVHHVQQR